MTLSNVQSSWRPGLVISRAAQVTAGILLLASAVRHAATVDFALGFENWGSAIWAQIQAAILAAGAALWFLVPSLFQGSLVLCRKGRARLLLALIFTGLLVYLMNFGLWLLAAQASPIRDRVPAPGVIYAFSGFAVCYLYAFVLPGKAFAYADRPVPVPAALRTGPVRIERSFRFGTILRPFSILTLLVFWGAGWFGLYRATWLPDPGLSDRVAAHWPILAGGVALLSFALFIGSGIGRTAAWRRNTGRRAMLGLAAVAVSVALLSPALTRGLPWAASFLVADGPGTQDVAVIKPGGGADRGGCARSAMVAMTDRHDLPVSLCDVPEAIWSGLKPGDTLRLSGIRTKFGLRVTAISRP